jgi:hypothetical protein
MSLLQTFVSKAREVRTVVVISPIVYRKTDGSHKRHYQNAVARKHIPTATVTKICISRAKYTLPVTSFGTLVGAMARTNKVRTAVIK